MSADTACTRALFSVVVPASNRAHILGECLGSLLAQTFGDWECIVVDDGSTDDTRQLVADYVRRDARFRYHWQSNSGVSSARNAGIGLATGEWVAFLDSDDHYLPHALDVLHKAVASHPEVHVFCGYLSNGGQSPDPALPECHVTITDALFGVLGIEAGAPPLWIQTSVIRRSRIPAIGPFAEEYGTAEDVEFWNRAAAAFPVGTVNSAIAYYRTDKGDGKHDRYMASGKKIEVCRRIAQDFAKHPVVVRRLQDDPMRPAFERWHRAYLLALAAAESIRGGEPCAAAARIRDAAPHCQTQGEWLRMASTLAHFLYYPRSHPLDAARRCCAWLGAIRGQLASTDDRAAREALQAAASDVAFRSARSLRRDGHRRQAWAGALAGLRWVPCVRSAKSLLHFVLDT